MKSCPYCGKEYPDEALVCIYDQEPLQSDVTTLSPNPKRIPLSLGKYQIFGAVWLLLCSYFAFGMVVTFFHLYSIHRLGSPLFVFLGIVAAAFLFGGIVASIFLIRGDIWARRFIGFIAVLCLLGCAGHFVASGYASGLQLLESAFSLVSIFVLFDVKRHFSSK